ncbi:unnamed protein product [Notodromas monacha]|uniref:Mitogen-activated protein kinase kinase kinase kinase n=1 Tax=Notodromas monacha TaxID=399045 RepID=A0A7R9BMD9_9CRUS|nr:unnamed protein product [Notodromas monacha]CAG0916672.1 unnamed protein product [Notodromas monacha]
MAYGGGPNSKAFPKSDISTRNPNDDYELIEKIGRGTYGSVFKAKKISTGEYAAIKKIQLEPGDDFSEIEREIIMLKDCRHPNIVAYYESYWRRGHLSICMEYCSGGSIMDLYRVTGPLSEKQIAFVCRETLRGLEYLHSRGKMHRDIKGANILITEEGDAKLADFGVSAQITDTFCKRKSFIGTPFWMAPEVAAVEKKGGYNHLCDIWAVGITAIEMAELDPPYAELHPMRALFIMSKRSFKPPTLKNKEKWSSDFRDFIKVALKKDPKKRPPAEHLLQHKFVTGYLTKALMVELLQKARALPVHGGINGDHDDEVLENVPQRIESRRVGRDKERTRSEILMENMNLPPNSAYQRTDEPSVAVSWVGTDDQINEAKIEGTSSEAWLENAKQEDVKKGLLHFIDEELRLRGHHGTLLPSDDNSYEKRDTLRIGNRRTEKNDTDTMVRSDAWQDAMEAESHTGSGRGMRRYSSFEGVSGSSPDDELADRVNTLTLGAQSERALSDTESSARTSRSSGKRITPEPTQPPEAPPRKRDRRKTSPSSSRDGPAKGLPPTRQAHMGAGFAKVFNCCPLKINYATSWVHPTTRNQHILIGADEGIYTLDLAELHEGTMHLLTGRKTTWMFAMKDVLMTISGKTPHLYSHDLLALHSQLTQKFSLPRPINRIPERFVPRRFAISTKIPDTKSCLRCCVSRNRFDGYTYLCGATPTEVFLMQWYEPLRKFMVLKTVCWMFPAIPRLFAMVISGDAEYPRICIDARHRYDDPDQLDLVMIDLSSAHCTVQKCDDDDDEGVCDGGDTLVPQNSEKGPRHVVQLEGDDCILVSYPKLVQIMDLDGRPIGRPVDDRTEHPVSSRLVSRLTFDFTIERIVCLADSVLAFHEHGFQGRSLTTGEVTQEITDPSRSFRVLGVERTIVVQSRPAGRQDRSEGVNLYILTGHEDTL